MRTGRVENYAVQRSVEIVSNLWQAATPEGRAFALFSFTVV